MFFLLSEMKKSVVGDPIFWPGLVYSPINISGLLFALGTVTGQLELLFEEFSPDDNTAICRRKTDSGWERVSVALAFKSSEFNPGDISPDMLICWVDDAGIEGGDLPVLKLSEIIGKRGTAKIESRLRTASLAEIMPENSADDLLHRGESIMEFEETVRQLDERIKKLKGG